MRKILLSTVAMSLLAACADPLESVDKIPDAEVVAEEPARNALADEAEIEREGGLLTGLFRRQPAPETDPDPVLAASAAADTSLAGAVTPVDSEPLAEVGTGPADAVVAEPEKPRGFFASLRRAAERREARELAQTTQDTDAVVAAVVSAESLDGDSDADAGIEVASLDLPEDADLVEPKKRRGLFGGLLAPRDPAGAEPEDVTEVSEETVDETATDTATETISGTPDEDAAQETRPDQPKRRGLFGGLFAAKDDSGGQVEDEVQVASLEPETGLEGETLVEPAKRRGLFGPRDNSAATDRARSGPDAVDVYFGDTVPYGTIARVCNARNEKLGRRVEKFGRSRSYALYDSKPDSTQPRTFYVTGFADGCPRQFTAALALFGAPSLHEQLRYGRPSEQYPYSTTDKAYEKVKSAICGVGRRKPCGDKIKLLEKNTVFISTYERYEDNGRWADILIHDGVVLAAALKDL